MVLATPVTAYGFYIIFSIFTYPLSGSPLIAGHIHLITSLLSVCATMLAWHGFLKDNAKYATTYRYKIHKVSRIIGMEKLSLSESRRMNASRGWDFDNLQNVQLSEKQIKEAHAQATEKGRIDKRLRLSIAVIAFMMAPFGFAGLLPLRGGGEYPPVAAGLFCLFAGCLLLRFSIKK